MIDRTTFYRIVIPLGIVLVILLGYYFTQSTYGVNFCHDHGKVGEDITRDVRVMSPCSFHGIPFAERMVNLKFNTEH